MNRQELFNKIQSLGFVLYDTALFLDTHPENALALDFYRENQEWYLKYRKEYESMYGPLTLNDVNSRRLELDAGSLAMGGGSIVCGIMKKD